MVLTAKQQFVLDLAVHSCKNDKKMTGKELAEELNRKKFKTSYGMPYSGGRGTFTLISTIYAAVEKVSGKPTASNIAFAFTKGNGKFAWKENQ